MHRHWLGQIVESFLRGPRFQESAPAPMHDRKLRPGLGASSLPAPGSSESSCRNHSQFPQSTLNSKTDSNYPASERLSTYLCEYVLLREALRVSCNSATTTSTPASRKPLMYFGSVPESVTSTSMSATGPT